MKFSVVFRVYILNNNDPGNHTTVIIRGMGSANASQRYMVSVQWRKPLKSMQLQSFSPVNDNCC